jgi:hypothetical protein
MLPAQFMHQHPAPAGSDQHFTAAGFAVPVGILSRAVNVKIVVGMFNQRYLEASHYELRDQLFYQRGFAAARVSCKSKDFHYDRQ